MTSVPSRAPDDTITHMHAMLVQYGFFCRAPACTVLRSHGMARWKRRWAQNLLDKQIHQLVVPVLRNSQSPTWIRLVNYSHLHLHFTSPVNVTDVCSTYMCCPPYITGPDPGISARLMHVACMTHMHLTTTTLVAWTAKGS